jgi:hypothetical protein
VTGEVYAHGFGLALVILGQSELVQIDMRYLLDTGHTGHFVLPSDKLA